MGHEYAPTCEIDKEDRAKHHLKDKTPVGKRPLSLFPKKAYADEYF